MDVYTNHSYTLVYVSIDSHWIEIIGGSIWLVPLVNARARFSERLARQWNLIFLTIHICCVTTPWWHFKLQYGGWMNPISQKQTPNHLGLPSFGITISILDGGFQCGKWDFEKMSNMISRCLYAGDNLDCGHQYPLNFSSDSACSC